MSDQSDHAAAVRRLMALVGYLSLGELRDLTNLVEHQVAWRMAEEKARRLTKQPHHRLADTSTVNYYNLLEFAQAIGADVQVTSQAWTWVMTGEEQVNPHSIEELRQRQVEVGYLRGRLRESRFSKVDPTTYLLDLWLAYL